jgi:hypothetical protein
MNESTIPNLLNFVPPVMHKERFAEWVGVSVGVVEGWSDRGYIPTVKIGKHVMVNLVLLTQDCLKSLPNISNE